MKRLSLVSAIAGLALGMLVGAAPVRAQQTAEIIRGRVTSDSGRALIAEVIVTRGPDRLTQRTTCDSSGDYRVRFDSGTGDYLVYVALAGYRSARRRVQRVAEEHELVANFVLAVDVATLAAQRITASKPERADNHVSTMQPEPGSSESWSEGVNGQLPPTVAGDLAAIAGTLSNVTVTPAGIAILGSGVASTLTTLNGMAIGASSVPRAASVDTRVTGTTYDATRGGFSGANIDVRLAEGNRMYQQRRAFFTLNPSTFQFTDPTSRSLGAAGAEFRGSAGADGELIRDALTYNVSLDVVRNSSDPVTLLDAGADALIRAGASPDSVARIRALAAPLGIPLSDATIPGTRLHNAFTLLSRLDDTRDSLARHTLTAYANYTTDGALGFGPLAAPSTAGERTQRTLGLQWMQDNFIGPGRRILTETRASASAERTTLAPYLLLPGAAVLTSNPEVGGGQDVSSVLLGGNSALGGREASWIAEGANETIWNAMGKRHRFKALIWGRMDASREEAQNDLGTYSFASISDLSSNRPSSFSRTIVQPDRAGTVWNAALAFSHQYAPSRWFGLTYGIRVEADGFGSAPTANPVLEQDLGVRTDVAPMRVHVSPRLGFTYTYNRNPDNGASMMANSVGKFLGSASGVVRGGIGEFRDLLQPRILASASSATGLPGATLALNCVGAAVPPPDWSRFEADASTIPSQCADGNGVLGVTAPPVSAIDPSYDVPRSWRASLDWSTSVGHMLLQVGGLASYDLNQPGTVDANFSGVPKLFLSSEGMRPIFVTSASIDTASGAVSSAESRWSDQFGHVGVRTSDLKGYGGQLTFRVAPDLLKWGGRRIFGSLGYTLQTTHRQFRGFDGRGFGDPRQVEWAPADNDARHILVLTGGVSTAKAGTITFIARAQSGFPFTPIVQGDVNGDGIAGDRAFIPAPRQEGESQLEALLTSGSRTARTCLSAHRGEVVPRNGCRGPWTESLNMQWSPRLPKRFGSRFTPTLYLQNVLAGLDQLVHGSEGVQSWGSPGAPDPVLFVPRGFDAQNTRFRYDVNARFGDARPRNTLLLNPFRLIIDVSVDLTTNPDLQQLRRAVEPVRAPTGWVRRSADSLVAFYLGQTSDVHKALLDQSDSLFLSGRQIAALRQADSVYSARVRAIYRPLAEFLARGNGKAGKAELDSVTATQKAYWRVFWEQAEVADSIVTPAQKELFPLLKSLVGTTRNDRDEARWYFGYAVQMQ
jgi:hypothetical protein